MFRGVQHINMDAKGRLAVPTRQREVLLSECEGKIVVTVDPQSPCLVIYPLPEWERVEDEVSKLPTMNRAVKSLQRLILGHATDYELDSNGRVLLTAALRDYAELGKKVVLVGLKSKLELWSEEAWLKEQGAAQEVLDTSGDEELPDVLMSLSL